LARAKCIFFAEQIHERVIPPSEARKMNLQVRFMNLWIAAMPSAVREICAGAAPAEDHAGEVDVVNQLPRGTAAGMDDLATSRTTKTERKGMNRPRPWPPSRRSSAW
jgi:hypothetical protein